MLTSAFSKHLKRSPIPDEEILSGLDWLSRMIDQVRTGPTGLTDGSFDSLVAELDSDVPETGFTQETIDMALEDVI